MPAKYTPQGAAYRYAPGYMTSLFPAWLIFISQIGANHIERAYQA